MKYTPDWVPEGHQVFHENHDHPITFSQNKVGKVIADKCAMGCETRVNRDGSIGVNARNNLRLASHIESTQAGTHDIQVGHGQGNPFYTFGASSGPISTPKSIEQTKEEKKASTYERKKEKQRTKYRAVSGKSRTEKQQRPGPKIGETKGK